MTHLLMFISSSPHPFNDGLVFDPDNNQEPVMHGGTFTAEDDRYDVLTADPYTASLIQEVTTDYSTMSRAELEQAARDAGVEDPDDWEQYPTEGSLSVAIEAANAPGAQQASVAPETAPPAEPGADEPTPPPQEGQ